jgi:hypothetical protein
MAPAPFVVTLSGIRPLVPWRPAGAPVFSSGRARRIAVPMLLVPLLLGGFSTRSLAQRTPDRRVSVTLAGAYQASTTGVTQAITFEQYGEDGSLTAGYTVDRGPAIDLGAVVRLWRGFGAGVAGSYFHDSGSAQVNALVPHPFFANQPRQISGPVPVSRSELALHIQAVYWIQPTGRLDIVVSGGPSVFRADQDFVSDVTFSQTFPYDTAAFESAAVVRERKTVTGGNVGAEVGWRLSRYVGVAGLIRYSRASASFPDTSAPAIVVGGLHLGGGVRCVF